MCAPDLEKTAKDTWLAEKKVEWEQSLQRRKLMEAQGGPGPALDDKQWDEAAKKEWLRRQSQRRAQMNQWKSHSSSITLTGVSGRHLEDR